MDFLSTLAAARSLNLEDRIRLVEAICNQFAADEARRKTNETQKPAMENRSRVDDANPADCRSSEVNGEDVRPISQ
jgi:hypothetical protein